MPEVGTSTAGRAKELFDAHRRRIHERTDRLFAALMVLQFLAGVLAAIWISPRTWAGPFSQVHIHVWTAILVGGGLAALPIALALLHPGRAHTRYVIATSQMLMSALLIHLSGGRIETHFHVFGSLAFLAFYRDWRVFIPATLVVAVDHIIRGIYWPQSVFGILTVSHWRWLEHAAWVIFEDIFLIPSCVRGVREMRQIANRRAELEGTNARIEATVHERTNELRASEELFRSLSTSSPIGIFRCETGVDRLVYANDQFLGITALSSDGLRRENWTRIIHEDDRSDVVQEWSAAVKNTREFSREFRIVVPERGVRWLRVQAAPLASGGGGCVGTAEDITEAREVAEALDRLRRQHELILHSVAEGVIGIDLEGRITFANPSAQKLLGWSPNELFRRRAYDVLLHAGSNSSDRQSADQSLHDVLREGGIHSKHDRFLRKDGSSFPVEYSRTSIEEDRIVGAVLTFRDVTKEHLLHGQLLQSQKLESIGQLAAGVAHEINTPTQYVGDNTRFLREAFEALLAPIEKCRDLLNDDGRSREALDKLRVLMENSDVDYFCEEIPRAIAQTLEGIDRIGSIVRAMKDFSQPSEERSAVDINQAIQSTITVARNEWKYVAEVKTDFDPDLSKIHCVAGEFNQVMLNMIVNASHAISEARGDNGPERGTITITTCEIEGCVEIRIADTGCGIAKEIRGRIFDPFFTTKEVGSGTGQGLHMVHSVVVHRHAGSIAVESEVGKGTTFVLRLPLKPASNTETISV